MPAISVQTGHVIVVAVAVVAALVILKVTKKVIGIAAVVGVLAALTKYLGLW